MNNKFHFFLVFALRVLLYDLVALLGALEASSHAAMYSCFDINYLSQSFRWFGTKETLMRE
jgi:hypothetical protein